MLEFKPACLEPDASCELAQGPSVLTVIQSAVGQRAAVCACCVFSWQDTAVPLRLLAAWPTAFSWLAHSSPLQVDDLIPTFLPSSLQDLLRRLHFQQVTVPPIS